jgi:hypothetical protein
MEAAATWAGVGGAEDQVEGEEEAEEEEEAEGGGGVAVGVV